VSPELDSIYAIMEEEGLQEEETEKKDEQLPIDARLLSEAVIEFNISRRSIGLYPPGHAVITNAIDKTYELLEKMFELRSKITLGIAKDVLVIDDNILDKNNPVNAECALSFHNKGLAAITFIAGIEKDEIISLHELLTMKDGPVGQELVDLAEKSDIKHVRLIPIDYSTFRFVKDGIKSDDSVSEVWEDYIYGLLSGRLTHDDTSSMLNTIPPEAVAEIINTAGPEMSGAESYDNVITSYLRGRGSSRLDPESMNNLFSLISQLSPEIKKQFMSKTVENISTDIKEIEDVLSKMSAGIFEKIVTMLSEESSVVPNSLKNIIDKLGSIKGDGSFKFDMTFQESAVVHDIEIGEDIIGLFKEDHFQSFVGREYQEELGRMMASKVRSDGAIPLEDLVMKSRPEVIDRAASEIMIEVLDEDFVTRDDYLIVVTKLTEMAKEFVETGRFEDVLNIYNTLYGHTFTGKFTHEAKSTVKYFFHSEAFISDFMGSARIWGRKNRGEIIRLARALRAQILSPLFDALEEEESAGVRRFLISVITEFENYAVIEAVKRLKSDRWYVVRNMIYIIRQSGTEKDMAHIKNFAKHPDLRVCMEAVRTLLRFKTPESIPYLKVYLQADDEDTREFATKLAGTYKIREAVPFLVEALQRKDFLDSSVHSKLPVVKALGELGDPRAIMPLVNIYKSKTLIYRGTLEAIREEMFRNLSNYPPKAVMPLVQLGLSSENQEIRKMSEQFRANMARKSKGGGNG
jgi:hypothetical protein